MYSGTFIESAANEHKLIFVKRQFFSDAALHGHRRYHFPTLIKKSLNCYFEEIRIYLKLQKKVLVIFNGGFKIPDDHTLLPLDASLDFYQQKSNRRKLTRRQCLVAWDYVEINLYFFQFV